MSYHAEALHVMPAVVAISFLRMRKRSKRGCQIGTYLGLLYQKVYQMPLHLSKA
jgi:hypothetical protein